MLTLRPYQNAAISSIYGYFQINTGNPLVVIPTAGGKSLVMAAFIEGVLKAWPDQRILIVTHVRELIAQNHAEMIGLWPDAPAGIYSAGLGKREAQARILFAGPGDGEAFRKGAPLIWFDCSIYNAALAEARAEQVGAKATLATKEKLDRLGSSSGLVANPWATALSQPALT